MRVDTMRLWLSLAVMLLGCTKAPERWPITEGDEYAVYQAILDINPYGPVVGVEIEASTAAERVSGLEPEVLEGFDPVAFEAFHQANTAPLKLDLSRLRTTGPRDGAVARYHFSRVGFDARGMRAVATARTGSTGNLFALVRTVDGRWAVTRIRMLWIS